MTYGDMNATLAEMRVLSLAIVEPERETLIGKEERSLRLAVLFRALDDWMASGNAPPDAWHQTPSQYALAALPRDLREVLRFFSVNQLATEQLKNASRHFRDLAFMTAFRAPNDPETVHALRALLIAKDCAVRAALSLSISP